MNTTGPALLAFALAGSSLAAQEPAKPLKTSSRVTQAIQATLPKYATPPAPVLDRPKDLDDDPDVLALPKVTVREKQAPRFNPSEMLARQELEKKLARAYRESLQSGLDRWLNSFTIPIFSASPAERGKSLEERRQFEDAYRLVELGRRTDPENAAKLKADLKQTERDIEWRQRPAGAGRAK